MAKNIKAPPPLLQREANVVLDFKQYFINFCSLHGEPVNHNGRLIFPDGWSYSSSEYEGPEYPPPHDIAELDRIVLQYWTIRRSMLTKSILKLQHQQQLLEKAQASHSLPLVQVVVEGEGDARRRSHRPLNLSGIEQQILWLEDDLRECEQRFVEIREYYEKRDKDVQRGGNAKPMGENSL